MKSVLAVLGGASLASAAVRGFNYGSSSGTVSSFASQFQQAASLPGGNNFTSARLYTMIQDGTTNTPIGAIQAAINTKTTLLLGLWASQDQTSFNNEISALTSAIKTYGSQLASLAVGISVGSEDLYRISPIGIANMDGVGQSPDVLVSYISQVRTAIKGTVLANVPVGHVDTWNVYVNGSNSEVIAACDWLGLDEYPYYQTTDTNTIANAGSLFFQAYDAVAGVAGGKPIWITESGWPVSGSTSNLAVASVNNAETYWQSVGCELERRNIPFWWYILSDAGASPSFGLSNNGVPVYNLTCTTPPASSTISASSGSSTASASGSGTIANAVTSSSGTSGSMTTSTAGAKASGSSSGSSAGSSSGTATSTSTAIVSTHTGAASHVAVSWAGVALTVMLRMLW